MISFSIAARNNNYVRPNVVADQVISVTKGRHPLQELTYTFIPNDIFSGQGHSMIKILTGPNTCGKSIYLKQVALIVYMALIGSYVPAESATVGLMTHIFTQISPISSISMDSSMFLQELQQVCFIIILMRGVWGIYEGIIVLAIGIDLYFRTTWLCTHQLRLL